METKLKLTIDGKEIEATPGQTILEAIQQNRIAEIPTLCHDPKLPPYGSCYLCVVEVQGVAKLIPSCSSPVANGMVVQTDNDRIRQARKTALELLLSNHYADCLAPCKQTCPAGVDVQGYIALVAGGRFHEAIRLIKETNPLPLVCGRVCVRECEIACRRNRVDSHVGIDYLKRYAADLDIEDPWTPETGPEQNRKVAVIGGGPAGLSCAYYLRLKGYGVTLFEQMPKLGGMLRYGIPEYRLPKKVLDREIKWITDLGVTVKTNQTLGRDFQISDLIEKGFSAVFLAPGAWKAKGMRLPDEDSTEGVIKGADFLRNCQSKPVPKLHGHVVVVGGGNTAIDAARTARRLGAERVTILYRRTRAEMPAHHAEIDAALAEDIELTPLSAPIRIQAEKGRLRAIECIRMALGEPDASGRRSPVPQPGSEYCLPCDFIISAIGQDVDLKAINSDNRLAVSRYSSVQADPHSFLTSLPAVFAGGDAITGPATAIEAIAHGRSAADAIDRFICTGDAAPTGFDFISKRESFGELPDSDFTEFPRLEKQSMPELPPAKRMRNFKEVELGFSAEQALLECRRCLECGCSAYFDCDLRRHASHFNVDISRFVGEVRRYRPDRQHPFIALDANKCIACGRCVRTCSEVLQVSALGFVYRGFKAVVKPAMEKRLQDTTCINCGNCIDACPTGAISEILPFAKPGPWKAEIKNSFCTQCSIGCRLSYKVFNDSFFTVAGTGHHNHNQGYLCDRGHFGYRQMIDSRPPTSPLIRRDNHLIEAPWDEAIQLAAGRLAEIRRRHGPQSIAVFAAPVLTNEELFLLQSLVDRDAAPSHSASFTLLSAGDDWHSLDPLLGSTASTISLDELDQADLILAINTHFEETNLIAELKIKAAQKRGAKVVAVSSSENSLTRISDLWIDAKRGTGTALLAGACRKMLDSGKFDQAFVKEKTVGMEEFRKSLAPFTEDQVLEWTGISNGKFRQLTGWLEKPGLKVAVIYQTGAGYEKSPHDMAAIASLLLLVGSFHKPGAGLLLLHAQGNTQGMLDLGYQRGAPELIAKMAGGGIRAAVVFGENPLASPSNLKLFSNLEFLLVADTARTPSADLAHVFIPIFSTLHSQGSFTAGDLRVQRMERVFQPGSGGDNWQIIHELVKQAVLDIPDDPSAAFISIQRRNPDYASITGDGQFRQSAIRQGRFSTPDQKAHFIPIPVSLIPSWIPHVPMIASESYYQVKIKGRLMV